MNMYELEEEKGSQGTAYIFLPLFSSLILGAMKK